jgi:hypothetical protein
MKLLETLRRRRDWFPVPMSDGRIHPIRWFLLEGDRLAVSGLLLTFVFLSLMVSGYIWTFEMQMILTETPTVENILDTFLSGIILLVSIVVSINSIVLSQDITSVETQEERVRGVMDFRRKIGRMTKSGKNPSDPETYLRTMSANITEHAQALEKATEKSEEEYAKAIQRYTDSVIDTVDYHNKLDSTHGGDFAVLWTTLEIDYGDQLDRARALRDSYEENISESTDETLDSLLESIQLFAIGREYFKTLYYTREISRLSRTLIVISLPAILVTATAILAINANVLPEFRIFGLPPLQSFVAAVFTIALSPYVILTAFVLRLSTVALHTATGGPFSLN